MKQRTPIVAAAVLVSALVLAACEQKAEAPVAEPARIADVVAARTGLDQAVGCMAHLALKQGALEAKSPPGDITAVRAALNDWEGMALTERGPELVAQSVASTLAVENSATPAVVDATSAWCLANAPKVGAIVEDAGTPEAEEADEGV